MWCDNFYIPGCPMPPPAYMQSPERELLQISKKSEVYSSHWDPNLQELLSSLKDIQRQQSGNKSLSEVLEAKERKQSTIKRMERFKKLQTPTSDKHAEQELIPWLRQRDRCAEEMRLMEKQLERLTEEIKTMQPKLSQSIKNIKQLPRRKKESSVSEEDAKEDEEAHDLKVIGEFDRLLKAKDQVVLRYQDFQLKMQHIESSIRRIRPRQHELDLGGLGLSKQKQLEAQELATGQTKTQQINQETLPEEPSKPSKEQQHLFNPEIRDHDQGYHSRASSPELDQTKIQQQLTESDAHELEVSRRASQEISMEKSKLVEEGAELNTFAEEIGLSWTQAFLLTQNGLLGTYHLCQLADNLGNSNHHTNSSTG